MRRFSWLLIVGACHLAGCNDAIAPPTERQEELRTILTAAIVSNPLDSSLDLSDRDDAPSLDGAATNDVVYVSVPPGTIGDATDATLHNRRTGDHATVSVVLGGFDPIGIDATVGDTIEIDVSLESGESSGYFVSVPVRRPLIVVRTDPPPRKRDVPLNARITIVLSEPVDPSTVAPEIVQLFEHGRSVAGAVVLAPDGLKLEFLPDTLLPSTDYVFSIADDLLGLDGEGLESPFAFEFSTVASAVALPSGVIAFASQRGGRESVYLLSTNQGTVVRIGRTDGKDYRPAWSPDGQHIAFAAQTSYPDDYINGSYLPHGIYVMDVDGANRKRLTYSGEIELDPAWSPDGAQILYAKLVGADYSIFVMNSDGSNLRLLNDVPGGWNASWSPDGSMIVFESTGIWVMNSDGSGARRLTTDDGDRAPAWSPDGGRIAFVRPDGNGAGDIYVLDLSDSSLVNLTNSPSVEDGPAWSPDGELIAFHGDGEGNFEIYVMNTDGSGIVNVTNDPAQDVGPSWSPDPRPLIQPHGAVTRVTVIPQRIRAHAASGILFPIFADVQLSGGAEMLGQLMEWTSSNPSVAVVQPERDYWWSDQPLAWVRGMGAAGTVTITATSGGHSSDLVIVLEDLANEPLSAIAEHSDMVCSVTSAGAPYCHNGHTPIALAGNQRLRSITPTADYPCGIDYSGVAICWRLDSSTGLGSSSSGHCDWMFMAECQPTPVFSSRRSEELTTTANHDCVRTDTGAVFCWGFGRSPSDPSIGQPDNLSFIDIDAQHLETCGVTQAGATYCWPYYDDWHDTLSWEPRLISVNLAITRIAVGRDIMCGITRQSSVYCWRPDTSAQIAPWIVTLPTSASPTHIDAGPRHACALVSDGAVYCWGETYGADWLSTVKYGPKRVANVLFKSVSSGAGGFDGMEERACGVAIDGRGYCWDPAVGLPWPHTEGDH